MDDRDRDALFRAANDGALLLDSIGFPWWLSHGTLLGAWRHQGVIPWDDDLDFAFPRSRIGKLEEAARSQGWHFARISPFFAKIWKPEQALYYPKRPWTWPFVDLALFDEAYSKVIVEYRYHTRFTAFEREDLLPTQRSPFGPLQLPIPKHPEVMLNYLYPSWSTCPASSTYCHRLEMQYPEPQHRMNVAKLVERFELFHIPPIATPHASICHGEHPQWEGPLHLFANGRMCRPDRDEGSYEIVERKYILLRWDRSPPESLIWINESQLYRDLTKPFTLKPL